MQTRLWGVRSSTQEPPACRAPVGPGSLSRPPLLPSPGRVGGSVDQLRTCELLGWQEKAWEVWASETAYREQACLRLKTSGKSKDSMCYSRAEGIFPTLSGKDSEGNIF